MPGDTLVNTDGFWILLAYLYHQISDYSYGNWTIALIPMVIGHNDTESMGITIILISDYSYHKFCQSQINNSQPYLSRSPSFELLEVVVYLQLDLQLSTIDNHCESPVVSCFLIILIHCDSMICQCLTQSYAQDRLERLTRAVLNDFSMDRLVAMNMPQMGLYTYILLVLIV